MNRRTVALAALLLAACSSDPTASGSGVPEAIVTSRKVTSQTLGSRFSVTAYTIDQNAQRMAGGLTAQSNGPAVVIDSVKYLPELLETRVFVTAASKSAAGVSVTVAGHGLSKDVTIVVS